MTQRRSRTLLALALQLAALLVLALAMAGVGWLDSRHQPRVLVLVDRSSSVPRAAADEAVHTLARGLQAAGGAELQRLEFAGRPDGAAPSGLDPSATNIEAALHAALARHAQHAFDRLVLVSDGHANAGDTARGLAAVHEAGWPLEWVAVGRPPPAAHIVRVLAPERAWLGQPVELHVQLAGAADRPLRLRSTVRTAQGQSLAGATDADGSGLATASFQPTRTGVWLVDLVLEDPRSGQVLHRWPDAAAVDVAPRAGILLAQGTPGPLARSLAQGGWPVDVIPASRLDQHADGLDGYQAVVLDDVAIPDAGPRWWRALVDGVNDRGLGLLVLGGERSFAGGGYRDSALEAILPVLAEPGALDQPAAVVFAVDKSGSMGQGTGGVDRFQFAQRGVLEAARGLAGRDSVGLLVFDAAPQVLLPLAPASAALPMLARPWPARPNGGTRLAPALDAAIGLLERVPGARRMLVLVTDGFVDDAAAVDLQARLARAGIELIALAVGPDADLAALQRLVGGGAGRALQVSQAAELPRSMHSELERQRARVERGQIAVTQREALPFAPGTWPDWPDVAAHAVTRARPDAMVPVLSLRGDPLIALRQSGRGRVAALTGGLGPWTPRWLTWPGWPRLAGGLAGWVSGAPAGSDAVLTVADLADGLLVEVDLGAGTGAPAGVAIRVNSPTAAGQPLALDPIAPGRLRAALPDAGPGLYTFVVTTAAGTRRQLHLRRRQAEHDTWGIHPAIDTWRRAGLVAAAAATPQAARRPTRTPPDRSLLALGLALFLAGVVVDRARVGRAGLAAVLRWRPRRA